MEQIKPVFEDNFVSIFLTVNDKYMPYLSVCIESIISNASNNVNYDILVFGSDLSEPNKVVIQKQIKTKNISLRFVNIYEVLANYRLKFTERFPVEVYFRIIATLMLELYKKIIFIDADLILNTDIAKLYDIEVENAIGACRDLTIVLDEEDNKQYHMNYLENTLEFTRDEIRNNYINAGVMLINLKYWRDYDVANIILDIASKKLYKYQDQDIINIKLKGNITILNSEWNTTAMPSALDRISKSRYKDEFIRVLEKPCIIHYNGNVKPWDNFRVDYFHDIWWSYARKTPYYETFLRDIWLKDMTEKISKQKFNNTLNENMIPATERIQNHLSYKLGRLMIKNSRSPLGWLKMPFSIISTIKEHKLLTKLTNKITKLPKIETLPDYKEALKYKNHMSYKLGEAFLKINKNWHKGGPIWFIFEMIKINKSKKNKAK